MAGTLVMGGLYRFVCLSQKKKLNSKTSIGDLVHIAIDKSAN